MQTLVLIALFGALGCLARYALAGWVNDLLGRDLPWGTFAVNVVGAFLIGLVMETALRTSTVSQPLRIALTVGFLGGLTTFSAFSYETFRMIEEARFVPAFAYAAGSCAACLLSTFAGIAAARQL